MEIIYIARISSTICTPQNSDFFMLRYELSK